MRRSFEQAVLKFARDGKCDDPPHEIVEHVLLTALHGYTKRELDLEQADWVLRQLTIISAQAQEQENERRRAKLEAERQKRRRR